MNAVDILEFGHQTVLEAIDGLAEVDWERPAVCGVWSAKDILAHLTSYEHVLIDVLYSLSDSRRTPTFDRWVKDAQAFNDYEVALRAGQSFESILNEYKDVHAETVSQIIRVPEEQLRQAGTLPWYGETYDLEDFIVYTFYGHKREHSAQIAVYRDHLIAEPVWKLRTAV